MKTIFIGGEKNAGKSSFINGFLMALDQPFHGIRSIRRFEKGQITGFDIVHVEEGRVVEKSPLATVDKEESKVCFDFQKSKEFLSHLLYEKSSPIICIDEVGRFEKRNIDYLKKIEELVDSPNIFVLVSLKKENLPFNVHLIEKSRREREIEYIELDKVPYREREEKILHLAEKIGISKIGKKGRLLLWDTEERKEESRGFFDRVESIDRDIYKMDYEEMQKIRENYKYVFYLSREAKKRKRATDLGCVSIETLERIKMKTTTTL